MSNSYGRYPTQTGPGVSSVSASSPLASSGGTTPNITIQTANGSQVGALSAADWNTFNNKQPAGNYITALTGDVTATGPGSVAATLANIPNKVYVDYVLGNDSNTGTIVSPWRTLQHAYNSISPSINQPYVIYLSGGNGVTDSSPITGKADVSIIADYQMQVPAITITSPVANSNGCAFMNIIFLGPVTWIRNDIYTMSCAFINCSFFSGPVIKQQGTGLGGVLGIDTIFNTSEFQLTNGYGVFQGCTFYGTSTFDDPGSSGLAYLQFDGGLNAGAMSFTGLYNPIYFSGFVHDVAFGASVSFSAGVAGPSPLEMDSAGLPPTITGTPGSITYLSQANAINGQVDVSHGGTGSSSLAANNVLLGNGTSPVQFVAPGTAGNLLTSDGSTWLSTPLAIQINNSYTSNFWGAPEPSLLLDSTVFGTGSETMLIASTDVSTDVFTTPISIITGDNSTNAATAVTGNINLNTGNISGTGTSASSGAVEIQTGNVSNGSGSSGAIVLRTGNGFNTSSVSLTAGTASGGTRGSVNLDGRVINAGAPIVFPNYLVANLPSASSAGLGARAFVTDATATTFNSIVAGLGSNIVPVFSDGTNWRIG